jgi:hypothetical protein
MCRAVFHEYGNVLFQTGLLTSGSIYLLRLPAFNKGSDMIATFVPGYSGGPVPDLHRIPY